MMHAICEEPAAVAPLSSGYRVIWTPPGLRPWIWVKLILPLTRLYVLVH